MASNKTKIAIVGFAASTIDEAPFTDETWEIWGLNALWRGLPRREDGSQAWDRWFDCHPRWKIESHAGHVAWLAKEPADGRPIYMQQKYDDIPASQPIPLDTLLNEFGPYFTCGPAYMLAMAILERPHIIGIWGIDMLHDTEYAYQRPCIDYYVGVARGRGINVYVPDGSSLAKSDKLYGYETLGPAKRRYVSTRVKKRLKQIEAQRANSLNALHQIDGAIETIQQFGLKEDVISAMAARMAGAGVSMGSSQEAVARETLEDYRAALLAKVTEMREEALRVMFSADGSLAECGYWADVAKHLERRGV